MKLPASIVALAIVAATVAVDELSNQKFICTPLCSIDQPHSVVPNSSPTHCSLSCFAQPGCNDFNFNDETKDCSLYIHKPRIHVNIPGCTGYKKKEYVADDCSNYDAGQTMLTIPSQCCAIPFTLYGVVHYQCLDDGGVLGCFYGDRQWKPCQQPADFVAEYQKTSTTALSADPAVSVPLLTVNRWILMQRRVSGGSVSFDQNWAPYRDGFGSIADDNYWLGLEKVYRLMQQSGVKLRVEIQRTSGLWYSAEYSTFSISDEAGNYQLTVDGYSGDAGDALRHPHDDWRADGKMFTTIDKDNDWVGHGNCANWDRSGWWYGGCAFSNLNYQGDDVYAVWSPDSIGGRDVQASRMWVKFK